MPWNRLSLMDAHHENQMIIKVPAINIISYVFILPYMSSISFCNNIPPESAVSLLHPER
jgi:hypothetical protein